MILPTILKGALRRRDCSLQQALTKSRSDPAMAGQAKRAEIVEVTLASALSHRQDVVGIPERSAACDLFQAVERQACGPGATARTLQCLINRDRIGMAQGAVAMVAGEDLVPQISGVGTQAMLMHAKVRAEGAPARGNNLELTPTAECAAVFAAGQSTGTDSSAR